MWGWSWQVRKIYRQRNIHGTRAGMLVYGVKLLQSSGCRRTLVLSVVGELIIKVMFRVVCSMVWGILANLFSGKRREVGLIIISGYLPVRVQYFLVILLTSIINIFLLMPARCFLVILLIAVISLLVHDTGRFDFFLVSFDQVHVSYLKEKEQQTRLQILKPRWLLVFIDAPRFSSSRVICGFMRGCRIAHGNGLIIA